MIAANDTLDTKEMRGPERVFGEGSTAWLVRPQVADSTYCYNQL